MIIDSSILCVLVHLTSILVHLISYAAYLIVKDHDDATFKFTHLNAPTFKK